MSLFRTLLDDYLTGPVDGKTLAAKLHVSEQWVSKWRTDQGNIPGEYVEKTADILGLSGKKREEFIFAAECSVCPAWVATAHTNMRDRVLALKAEALQLRLEREKLRAEADVLRADAVVLSAQLSELQARVRKAGLRPADDDVKPIDN